MALPTAPEHVEFMPAVLCSTDDTCFSRLRPASLALEFGAGESQRLAVFAEEEKEPTGRLRTFMAAVLEIADVRGTMMTLFSSILVVAGTAKTRLALLLARAGRTP